MTLLTAEGLCKAFGGVTAARDVGFAVGRGEKVALIGPNGAGKSTCFNIINGQLAPDGGDVRWAERSIVGLPPREVWRLGVGRTFQIAATFNSMTVAENVQMALMSCRRRHHSLLANARRLYRDEALSMLAQVGMANQAERSCSTLAYGDVKRVELAVALASEPKLLLMDEPTAGMAPRERGELMRLAASLARERNMSVLFTEHDMDAVFAHADRVLVLGRGEIIAAGTPDEVRADARVRQAYLGATGTAAAERARRGRAGV